MVLVKNKNSLNQIKEETKAEEEQKINNKNKRKIKRK